MKQRVLSADRAEAYFSMRQGRSGTENGAKFEHMTGRNLCGEKM